MEIRRPFDGRSAGIDLEKVTPYDATKVHLTSFRGSSFHVTNYGHLVSLPGSPCEIAIPYNPPADGMYVVYGFIDPFTTEMFYVGKTKSFIERMKQHCYITYYHNPDIPQMGVTKLNARKLSICNNNGIISCAVLAICCSETVLEITEKAMIQAFRSTLLNTMINFKVI